MRVDTTKKMTMGALILALSAAPALAQQSEPAVKLDGDGQCIAKADAAFEAVKLFMPFSSMADCVRAGGRKPGQ